MLSVHRSAVYVVSMLLVCASAQLAHASMPISVVQSEHVVMQSATLGSVDPTRSTIVCPLDVLAGDWFTCSISLRSTLAPFGDSGLLSTLRLVDAAFADSTVQWSGIIGSFTLQVRINLTVCGT